MNSLTDTAAVFRYHKEMINLHGNDNTHALGWSDPQSQLTRFKVLSEIADLNCSSVMDAGCGHGDLCPYLKALYPDCRYLGIEQIPELMETALERYGNLPETIFLQGNFITSPLPVTDYILVCGSLNYSSSDPEYIYKAIRKLFENCRIGLGFNLLSRVSKPGLLRSYNADDIFHYSKNLSANVKLIEDYSEDDFTIFMYH